MSMGCLYTIVAYGPDPGVVSTAAERALDEVDRIDRLMSHYKPDEPALAAQPTRRLARRRGRARAVRLHRRVAALQPRVRRRLRHHGRAADEGVGLLPRRGPRAERGASSASARSRVGYRHVVLDGPGGTIAFDRAGVELDLGGIAKGYAVDRVVACCDSAAVTGGPGQRRRQHDLRRWARHRSRRVGVDVQDPLVAGNESPSPCAARSRALRLRQLREVVRARRRRLLAHHGPAHGDAGARRAERRRARADGTARRRARQRRSSCRAAEARHACRRHPRTEAFFLCRRRRASGRASGSVASGCRTAGLAGRAGRRSDGESAPSLRQVDDGVES